MEVITLREGIETVQALCTWLKNVPEDFALQHKEGEVMVIDVVDAQRAGRTLQLLMHSAGMA